MSDEPGSSGSSGKRKASEISEPEIPKVSRNNPTIYGTDSLTNPYIFHLRGWDEAQDPNKPPLEPKNTDDRTMDVYKVFGENISVLEVLEELGYKEGDKLPEGDMTTPVEDPNEDFKIDYYPSGLVTVVADTIKDIPNTLPLDEDSSKGEIMYHIVGYLNHYGRAKDKKIIQPKELEAIRSKYSEGRLKPVKTGGKKRRRKTKRRKSRRKRKTKKRKRTRRKGRKRRKRKTRR